MRKDLARTWEDYELLEMLLMHANPRKDTKAAAKALCERFGALAPVLDADLEELETVPGVGPRASELLRLVRAIVTRYYESELPTRDILSSPESVVRFCRASFGGEGNEAIHGLLVNTRNRLIRSVRLAEGTVDRTPLFPRRVVEEALRHRAKAVILVHNHPSGDPSPSADDHTLTEAVSRALGAVGVPLFDHLIVSRTDHWSFKEQGLLK